MTLTIYGDSKSGNCLKIRYVCDFIGRPYRWIETSVLEGQTRTPEFQKINPIGQVPVVVLEDGRTLSQSNAIMIYLAEGTVLIPHDAYDRAVMFQWLFFEQYNHEPNIATRRYHKASLGKSEAELDPRWKIGGERALSMMEARLASVPFFAGQAFSLADIALVAYTRVADEGGFDLEPHPNVRKWIGVVERQLSLT